MRRRVTIILAMGAGLVGGGRRRGRAHSSRGRRWSRDCVLHFFFLFLFMFFSSCVFSLLHLISAFSLFIMLRYDLHCSGLIGGDRVERFMLGGTGGRKRWRKKKRKRRQRFLGELSSPRQMHTHPMHEGHGRIKISIFQNLPLLPSLSNQCLASRPTSTLISNNDRH